MRNSGVDRFPWPLRLIAVCFVSYNHGRYVDADFTAYHSYTISCWSTNYKLVCMTSHHVTWRYAWVDRDPTGRQLPLAAATSTISRNKTIQYTVWLSLTNIRVTYPSKPNRFSLLHDDSWQVKVFVYFVHQVCIDYRAFQLQITLVV
jgi:hypothetical protein